ncbi:hypothetical protein ABZU76_44895 [Amycolatopsis sp. NPDC005232]|uniref:hypothetical protein n=1 Tax=Amycolatopsis sp. NPDC005232 TaxID=3157027 RepID=UPI0033A5CA4D
MRAVVLAGGATAIPRWTLDPAPGVAEQTATLDDDLAAALCPVWPRTRRCGRAVSLKDIAELPHREHAPNC